MPGWLIRLEAGDDGSHLIQRELKLGSRTLTLIVRAKSNNGIVTGVTISGIQRNQRTRLQREGEREREKVRERWKTSGPVKVRDFAGHLGTRMGTRKPIICAIYWGAQPG